MYFFNIPSVWNKAEKKIIKKLLCPKSHND